MEDEEKDLEQQWYESGFNMGIGVGALFMSVFWIIIICILIHFNN